MGLRFRASSGNCIKYTEGQARQRVVTKIVVTEPGFRAGRMPELRLGPHLLFLATMILETVCELVDRLKAHRRLVQVS